MVVAACSPAKPPDADEGGGVDFVAAEVCRRYQLEPDPGCAVAGRQYRDGLCYILPAKRNVALVFLGDRRCSLGKEDRIVAVLQLPEVSIQASRFSNILRAVDRLSLTDFRKTDRDPQRIRLLEIAQSVGHKVSIETISVHRRSPLHSPSYEADISIEVTNLDKLHYRVEFAVGPHSASPQNIYPLIL